MKSSLGSMHRERPNGREEKGFGELECVWTQGAVKQVISFLEQDMSTQAFIFHLHIHT